MYTDYAEDINSKNPFYIGTVVDNKDPTRNYRVKVRLPVLHKKIPDNKLPWAARVDRSFRGIVSDTPNVDGPNSGDRKDESKESKKKTPPKFDHCVPEIGTKVLVLAIQNDVNSLIYLGALYKKTDLTPTEEDPYLKTYGIYGDEEQFVGIDCTDDEKNKIKVHFIGDINVDKVKKIDVKAEEEITVTGKKDITIKVDESEKINVIIINEKGSVKVRCKNLEANVSESVLIKSPKIKLDGDVEVTGNVKAKGEVSAKGGTVNLSTHKHTYNPGPGDPAPTSSGQG